MAGAVPVARAVTRAVAIIKPDAVTPDAVTKARAVIKPDAVARARAVAKPDAVTKPRGRQGGFTPGTAPRLASAVRDLRPRLAPQSSCVPPEVPRERLSEAKIH